MTPGGSSSPFLSFSLRSSVILRSTSICREVISSTSSIFSISRGSFSLSFRRFRLRVEIFSISSRVYSVPLTSWRAFVFFSALAGEDFDVHDGAFNARRAIERSVTHIAGFFAEDRTQQLLFRSQRGFALGRYLADQNVAGLYDGADTDHAAFIQVAQERFADVGDVARDFFRTQLGVARFNFILFDVNRGVVILFDQLFANENRVFKVVSAPWHERHQHVAAKSQFTAVGARTVGKNLLLLHAVAHANDWLLVNASVLVRTLELGQGVDVRANFTAQYAGVVGLHANDDALGVHLIHDAVPLAKHDRAGIARRNALHAGADQRSFSANQRHALTLHVRTHQRAVSVVVFEEWNQAGRDADQLLRRHVHVIDLFAALQYEVAGLPAVHQFGGNLQTFVECNVGLRDHVLVLFPSGKIEAVRLVDHFAAFQFVVKLFDAIPLDNFASLEFAVARIHHLHVVDDPDSLHLAVRRFDEAVIIDARKAAERADQADVRTFRRFNRANTAVVGWVNVAHFESRAFTGKTAWSKSRKTPLVRNFAQRIGLVHELAQLRTAEELANRGHNRLGVDEVVRHCGRHFLVHAHLFFDGAFHANQADAELVFQQFAHCANAAVTQVVDVIHYANALAQFQQILDGRDEVRRIERAIVERCIKTEFDVELQAADTAEIVFTRVEKHSAEKICGRLERRRIAWA